jgi:hypothetical protein
MVDHSLFYATEENKVSTKFLYDFNYINISNSSNPFWDYYFMDADFKYFYINTTYAEASPGQTYTYFKNFFVPDEVE